MRAAVQQQHGMSAAQAALADAEAKLQADAMSKAVRKLLNIKRASAFVAWMELVAGQKRMRHVPGWSWVACATRCSPTL